MVGKHSMAVAGTLTAVRVVVIIVYYVCVVPDFSRSGKTMGATPSPRGKIANSVGSSRTYFHNKWKSWRGTNGVVGACFESHFWAYIEAASRRAAPAGKCQSAANREQARGYTGVRAFSAVPADNPHLTHKRRQSRESCGCVATRRAW